MKLWKDYSEKEKLEMKKELIEEVIQRELLHKGVGVLPEYPEPVKPQLIIDKNQIGYKINIDCIITDKGLKEELSKVLESIKKAGVFKACRVDILGPNYKYLGKANLEHSWDVTLDIEEKKYYKPEDLRLKKSQIKFVEGLKDQYKDEKDNYDKVMKKYNEVYDEIYTDLEKLQQEKVQKEKIKKEYEKFVKTTGDKETAKKYFKDIYPEKFEVIFPNEVKGGGENE